LDLAIPKLRQGSYFPEWLLERRKRAEDLLAFLACLAIPTDTVEHPPLFTVEESTALRGDIPGGHTKNLFVKDKKGRERLGLKKCYDCRKQFTVRVGTIFERSHLPCTFGFKPPISCALARRA